MTAAQKRGQTRRNEGRSPHPHRKESKMSLYGALNIGVAGLDATSAALSATSSNIANVNTVGYKDETANFETFLNTPGLSSNSSAGVSALITQNVTAQGLPVSTSSPTDLSISGNGMFVVA